VTPPGAEDIDDPGDLLQAAVELAVSQARRDATTRDAPPPPSALRPVLSFRQLPSRAFRTVREVLDRDDEFRTRVAEGTREADLDRASWLFLTRPEGWREELDLLVAAATEEREGRRQSREEQRAERRAAQLGETVERLRGELGGLRDALEETERHAARERAARAAADQEREELSARIDQLEEERRRAVRSLKDTEATAVERLAEVRSLRARLAEALEAVPQTDADAATDPATTGPAAPSAPTVPSAEQPAPPSAPSPWEGRDPEAVASAVRQASEAAALLASALARAAVALDGAPTQPDARDESVARPDPPSATADPTGERAPRPPRRVPVRLTKGVHEGSVEGLEQLLGTPGLVVVVDGYNVSKEGWPNLDPSAQRDSLVAALGAVRTRTGAQVHVVFDGDAEGGRPAVGAPLPVRVHFSPAEVEADDVILEMVAGLPTDVPVLVVSSDRRVADGARRLGANSVRSRELLDLVRR
jgi:predicted RNA-binding protein with PIN domain